MRARCWLAVCIAVSLPLVGCVMGNDAPSGSHPNGTATPTGSGGSAISWQEVVAAGEGAACVLDPFGEWGDFNVLTLAALEMWGTDIEGQVAVGGNAKFTAVTLGLMMTPPDPLRNDLVVGGILDFMSGSVPNGAIAFGAWPGMSPTVTTLAANQGVPLDFTVASMALTQISAALGALPAPGMNLDTTVQTANSDGTRHELLLSGTDVVLNVFTVAAADLSGAYQVTITVPLGSSVLINVSGSSVTLANMHVFLNGVTSSGVLFNLPTASSITIEAVELPGSILAPRAQVSFPHGLIDGQLFAKSLSGGGQINLTLFSGCLPVPPCVPACVGGAVCLESASGYACACPPEYVPPLPNTGHQLIHDCPGQAMSADWLEGNDTVYGYDGNDTIHGGPGDDFLYGGLDRDLLLGNAGLDILYGSSGDDRLQGGDGSDKLNGGPGNDILIGNDLGQSGIDWLEGGDGADYIVVNGNGSVVFPGLSYLRSAWVRDLDEDVIVPRVPSGPEGGAAFRVFHFEPSIDRIGMVGYTCAQLRDFSTVVVEPVALANYCNFGSSGPDSHDAHSGPGALRVSLIAAPDHVFVADITFCEDAGWTLAEMQASAEMILNRCVEVDPAVLGL